MTTTITAPELSDPFIPQGYQAPAFEIKVYDKTYAHVGFLGGYVSMSCVVRHNAISTADVVLWYDHPRVPDLTAPGARMRIFYDGRFLMSGRVESRDGILVGPEKTRTFHLVDDFQYLSYILGWPNPTGAITAQGVAGVYDTYTGPAEDVVSDLLEVNADRLGLPLTVPTSLGRGATISMKIRMQPLADRLLPKVDQAGLGIRIVQNASGELNLLCYEPVVRTRVLTEDSGVLVAASFTQADATLSRVVIGGQGEFLARVFRTVVDSARESTYMGTIKEAFVDARDADTTGEMDERGDEALLEASSKYGLSLTLAETRSFRYGTTFNAGDIVTVNDVTDVVREVTLTDTAAEGLVVSPTVGDQVGTSSLRIIAHAVSSLLRDRRQKNGST